MNVCGYPRDKTLYTQWIAHDPLDDPQPKRNGNLVANLFTYKADTCLGQSGSPDGIGMEASATDRCSQELLRLLRWLLPRKWDRLFARQ